MRCTSHSDQKVALTLILLLAIVGALAGCAATRNLGYAGQHPGWQDITCKGRVGITGSATFNGSLAYGGSVSNSFSLNGDCGEGFSIGRAQGMVGGNVSVVAPPQ